MNRFAGMFTVPELQLLAQVVDQVPEHMIGAPSIKDAVPIKQIDLRKFDDFKEGAVFAPTIRGV